MSVTLGVARSVANDVIMRIACFVAAGTCRRYNDWRHVVTGCNALVAVKVNGQYCWDTLLSQQIVDAIIASFMQDSAQHGAYTVHLAFNTVQLLQCKTLNFLSPEL